ncbi:MAG: right-handed parallel beta-helix repeat-containing protein, partial [Candidatus Bathyarchaeota archaeon]|nr:right-handed parallel beta-helix repeat-containing protein [Candidatus Bathyarchaeota archaeon]
MSRKLVLLMTLTLLIGILGVAVQVHKVEATATIYIRADGTVEGTDKIQRDDDVYTLTDNINDSVVVERDDIVVDGAGYTLQGPGALVYGSKGIDLTGRSNVTIKNMEIEAFEFGIFLWESSNNSISGNTLTNNGGGIYLWQSSKNTLSSNVMNDNKHNFGVAGGELHHYLHNVDISNLVDGNPVYYWLNQHGAEIPSDAGYVALVNSTEITVKDLTLSNNREGLLLVITQNSHIANNTLTNNGYGIVLCQSSSNSISGNNITT